MVERVWDWGERVGAGCSRPTNKASPVAGCQEQPRSASR
jgi:hypothetical protein